MFITLEGPEGSGKTLQLPKLADYLRQSGYDVLTTREPGGTSISEQIRTVLHNLENKEMNPRTEILLFQASRAQLVEQVIRPHLVKGGIVVSDRYADSTLAYQGYGHQIDIESLRVLVSFATGGLKPDLTILLDVDVEIGLRRKELKGEWNRLDAYNLDFHQRVRQGYLRLVQADPERWEVIDASQSPMQVQNEMRRVVAERLKISKQAGTS
ncbi:MAG: dTMP kinase [Chloroflexi bacterium RBG_13_50_21]|nr:MAG: dTMP kinase [Chloroflexi bacterium RBG_13_50_21]OGO63258.1 MAG: dTMP kinase [Chloroflexi bacterium RBG_19FT_COMBO_50_10]